ncbi:MAG TPA: MFS transporter, partial [Conexibacter sp.]|nr:MFS transporter [Conexibacter sp.]
MNDDNRRWWILATMTGSLSMILIDQTVVSVALPTMQRDLDLSTTGLQWVINAYLLSIAVFVALGGRAGDLLGHVRIFRAGALLFVLASAACGFAQSETWIIVARTVQGVGAAMMTPSSQAIVTNTFGPSERGRAMGIYAGISMVFLALGPLVGGLLVEGITWRAVFFVNLPVGLVMLALAGRTLRRDAPQGGRMDWVGAPLIVLGLGALVLALMQSNTWGWG